MTRILSDEKVNELWNDSFIGSDPTSGDQRFKFTKLIETAILAKLSLAAANALDHIADARKMVPAVPAIKESLTAPELEARQGWVRYEKLRKVSPRQFDELYARNLKGEFFDDMVDSLPEPSTPKPWGFAAPEQAGKEGV